MQYVITDAELQALMVFREMIDRLAIGEGVEHARFAPSHPQYDSSITKASAKPCRKSLKISKNDKRKQAINVLCSALGNDFRLFVKP